MVALIQMSKSSKRFKHTSIRPKTFAGRKFSSLDTPRIPKSEFYDYGGAVK